MLLVKHQIQTKFYQCNNLTIESKYMNRKITITKQNKPDGHRVVLVGGCFDVLHYGHISFLKSAKQLGDTLIVALESDANVNKMKGSQRPVHNQMQRRQMLAALSMVDQIIPLPVMNSDSDYRKLVLSIKPHIIATTQGDPMIQKKQQHAASVGAKLKIIPKVRTPSTSQLAKLIGLE
ncbi:hypothetical protein A2154_00655 [Candidatus Gottesmanbacteria bacterium RBG_16_43_7]|uniref:Cytidyltransferase-like domain-containing protein n=1 Tax=Candidatus Gottesmanbacteria bacterium RBG_16_43_7 TaxID=1798373 RepID=A0A1F5Z911_9BACT|nr:MAG: hypothetical protein A2154_00655 [Candidatus Gottesmanbacteria bacterium RBG_16_43_7]